MNSQIAPPLGFSFACSELNFDSFTNNKGSKTEEKIFWDASNETLFLEKLGEKIMIYC